MRVAAAAAAPSSDSSIHEMTLRNFALLLGTTVIHPEDSGNLSSQCTTEEMPVRNRLDLLLARSFSLPALSVFPVAAVVSPAYPARQASYGIRATDAESARRLALSSLSRTETYDQRAVLRRAPRRMAESLSDTFSTLIDSNLRSFAKLHRSESPSSVAERVENSFLIDSERIVKVRKCSTLFATTTEEVFSSSLSRSSSSSSEEGNSSPHSRDKTSATVKVRFILEYSFCGASAVETATIEGTGAIIGKSKCIGRARSRTELLNIILRTLFSLFFRRNYFHLTDLFFFQKYHPLVSGRSFRMDNTGEFFQSDPLRPRFDSVELTVDAPALLLTLRQQARLAAYKAVTSLLLTPNSSLPLTESPAIIKNVPPSPARHEVTPHSSPQLTSLIRAAAALEPTSISLTDGGVKRGITAAQVEEKCRLMSLSGESTLPPKKRMRRRVFLPPDQHRLDALTNMLVWGVKNDH